MKFNYKNYKMSLHLYKNSPYYIRKINSFTTDEFQSKLSTESWKDTNVIFKNILSIYFKLFLCMFH